MKSKEKKKETDFRSICLGIFFIPLFILSSVFEVQEVYNRMYRGLPGNEFYLGNTLIWIISLIVIFQLRTSRE